MPTTLTGTLRTFGLCVLINVMISNPVGPKSNCKLTEIFETPLYNKTGVRNNPSGMNLAYSDQVSLIIHIPISIYISRIFKNKKGVVAFICSLWLSNNTAFY